jgi:hypothetical protein
MTGAGVGTTMTIPLGLGLGRGLGVGVELDPGFGLGVGLALGIGLGLWRSCEAESGSAPGLSPPTHPDTKTAAAITIAKATLDGVTMWHPGKYRGLISTSDSSLRLLAPLKRSGSRSATAAVIELLCDVPYGAGFGLACR